MCEEGGTMSRLPELRERRLPTVIREFTENYEMQHNGVHVCRATNLQSESAEGRKGRVAELFLGGFSLFSFLPLENFVISNKILER